MVARTQVVPALSQGAQVDAAAPLARGALVGAYASLIYLAMRLREGDPPSIPPAQFRSGLGARLDAARELARARGATDADRNRADFAVTATLDEAVLQGSGPLRDVWVRHSLQFERYQHEQGGERFFAALSELERDGSSSPDLLEVFLLCLEAGFHGRLRDRADERERVIASVRAELERRAPPPSRLSPRRPQDVVAPDSGPTGPTVRQVALAVAAILGVLWIVLYAAVASRASSAADEVRKLVGGP